MKALSLRQPWPQAILWLGKTIENRRWRTSYRGEFLIHAAKEMTPEYHEEAVRFCIGVLGKKHEDRIRGTLDASLLRRGGIVGRARVTDVLAPCMPKGSLFPACQHPWHMSDQYGMILSDASMLDFHPCPGMPGFFDVEWPPKAATCATCGGARFVPRGPEDATPCPSCQ